MMRPGALCLASVVAGAICLTGCGESPPPAGSGAMECIRALSQSSREGCVEDYLRCFAPAMRRKLERARDEMQKGEFADYLRRRAEPVKGFAMYDEIVLGEETVRLKVEWVFQDRNEIQTFQLKKIDGQWKIVDMDEAQYRKPPVPYGTPVNE